MWFQPVVLAGFRHGLRWILGVFLRRGQELSITGEQQTLGSEVE